MRLCFSCAESEIFVEMPVEFSPAPPQASSAETCSFIPSAIAIAATAAGASVLNACETPWLEKIKVFAAPHHSLTTSALPPCCLHQHNACSLCGSVTLTPRKFKIGDAAISPSDALKCSHSDGIASGTYAPLNCVAVNAALCSKGDSECSTGQPITPKTCVTVVMCGNEYTPMNSSTVSCPGAVPISPSGRA